MLDVEYPEAALIAEWNGPRMSLKNGFDMDFYLNWQGNGYNCSCATMTVRWTRTRTTSARRTSADSGTGIDKFLDEYLPAYKATHKDGLWCFITCNHDMIRPPRA